MSRPKKKAPAPAPARLEEVPLDVINEPDLPMRMQIDQEGIEQLAASIRKIGLVQPIKLRPAGNRYEIIAGHRRYLASRRLGLPTIQAIIETQTDEVALLARAAENLDRQDTSPFEQAEYLKACKLAMKITNRQLAGRLGKSEAWVSQRLAILEYPQPLQDALKNGKISFSVARQLARIPQPELLAMYTRQACDNGVTPRVAEQWASDCIAMTQRNYSPDPVSEDPVTFSEPEIRDVRCYVCERPTPLRKAKNLWWCNDCLKAAISLLLEQTEH
ncbi:ParB/RepB/Spo0J family partition protein [Candidatus Parcubacteria bacterium]|nr:MAG: ParB/RepB/Spo0J family partition protein [Candidatus Parcubacteria bacterium]